MPKRQKKMKGSLLAEAVPESEYQKEKRKERERAVDEEIREKTSPPSSFNFQKMMHRGSAEDKVPHHQKVDVKQKEKPKAVEVEKPKSETRRVKKHEAKVPEAKAAEAKAETPKADKPMSEKKSAHAENLRAVQKLRNEKGLSLKDAWALFRK